MKLEGTKTRAAIIAICAFVVSNAYAAGWSAQVTIQQTGNAVFTTSGNTNPDNCITSHWLELDGTQANFNLLYATIMTAVATGSPVTL